MIYYYMIFILMKIQNNIIFKLYIYISINKLTIIFLQYNEIRY